MPGQVCREPRSAAERTASATESEGTGQMDDVLPWPSSTQFMAQLPSKTSTAEQREWTLGTLAARCALWTILHLAPAR